MRGRPLARMGLLAGTLAFAFLVVPREAHASLYTYSTQQISNLAFTGGTVGTVSTNTTTSAVSNAGSEGFVNPTDALQSYVGPAPRPPENFFGQVGQVNPNYVRGDVLISPAFTISTVAEGYQVGVGDAAGIGAFSLSGLVTVTTAGTVSLSFNYANLLQVINTGGTPTNSASASYALDFTIATPGQGGTVVFESAPVNVNSSASLSQPGSITNPDSGSLTLTSGTLAAGTYQATLTGSSRVFLSASAVPEPATIASLAIGLVGAFGYALKRRSSR